jgi:Ala-tRNA(Pro) deacylase
MPLKSVSEEPMTPTSEPRTPDDLFAFLDRLGIAVSTISHPPLFTVADSQALRGPIEGAHTKNLFLRDRKGAFFLLTVEEDASVDLKAVHQIIGASGRVSFGKPEQLLELLGVRPGAVTVFGALNDGEGRVKIVLDEPLMAHDVINAHPLTNEATTSIGRDDLLRFLEATGHKPAILKVSS